MKHIIMMVCVVVAFIVGFSILTPTTIDKQDCLNECEGKVTELLNNNSFRQEYCSGTFESVEVR